MSARPRSSAFRLPTTAVLISQACLLCGLGTTAFPSCDLKTRRTIFWAASGDATMLLCVRTGRLGGSAVAPASLVFAILVARWLLRLSTGQRKPSETDWGCGTKVGARCHGSDRARIGDVRAGARCAGTARRHISL